MRSRICFVAALLVAVVIPFLVAHAASSSENQLLELVQEIAALRSDLAGMENRILTDGSDDIVEDEIRNFQFEQQIQELGAKLLSIEGDFLAEEKNALLERALATPSTRETWLAALELLRVEELIALAKGELSAAWQESSLIQQKLTLEIKRAIEDATTNLPPEACFKPEQDAPTAGVLIAFDDCSTDPDGEIVAWRWEFDDGTVTDEPMPVHAFDEPGTRRVTLMVTDDKGATATVTRTIEILPAPPVACIVAPAEVLADTEVPLASCSTDPDGEIISWSWKLGDGSESSLEDLTHVFGMPGIYTIELQVTDNQGLTDTARTEIQVISPTGSLQVVLSDDLLTQRGELPKDILLVLDLSSSMEQAFEGSTKIAVATEVIREVLQSLPQEAQVGLRTFHRCGQSTLDVPIRPLAGSNIFSTIENLETYGTTPLAYTIRQIPGDLEDREGPHLVIFITDGIETCEENPVAAARELTESGLDVIFRLVGYDISNAREQLQAISDAADGTYTDATTRAELIETLRLALPLTYRILGADETVVWEGIVGEPAVELPVGVYSIAVETVPQLLIEDIVLGSNETVTITVSSE